MFANKKSFLCVGTIILLLIIIGIMVANFVFGKTETGVDGRTAIVLEEGERVRVLFEMRQFLNSIQVITEAVTREDMDTVAVSARSVGMEVAEVMPPTMMAKIPLEFMNLGMAVHNDFDKIAEDAEILKDPQHTLEQLSAVMSKCVACHATYQLKIAP